MFCLPLYNFAAEDGWNVGLDTTLEASAGLCGGARQGQTLHGLALVHADWKPAEKPAGGLTCTGSVCALALAGKGPTEKFTGDFLATSNIEGYQSARLYSWWLEAGWRDWSLRSGVLLADMEFAGTKAGGSFFNSAFGWPAFISANTINTGPAFYVAAPGLRLERKCGEAGAWRLGLYDGDSFDSPSGDPQITRHGLHYQLRGDQGCFMMTEGAFPLAGGTTRVKLGAWLHTATFADLRDDASGQPYALSGNEPRKYHSNHGTYAVIEHTVTGESGQAGNVEFFIRCGVSPADRNALAWALDTGFGWTGPIPGRPADIAALGLAHARFGSKYADAALLADPMAAVPDYEQVIEASYTVVLSDHLNLQPDLQFIRHPGGSVARRDACLFQFRLNASY